MKYNSMRQKFIDEMNYPILFTDDELFVYFMNLYDPMFKTWDWFRLFFDTITACNGEHGYHKEIKTLISEVTNHINSNTDFLEIINGLNTVQIPYVNTHQIISEKIYSPKYVNKKMIAIDMKSANFNAIHSINPDVFNGKETYELFMKDFTSHEFFHKNKQIRQTIFGNTVPKKLQFIQKKYMKDITHSIISENPDFIISEMGSDEIIIVDYPNTMSIADVYFLAKQAIPADMLKYFSIDIIEIEQIHPERHFFNRQEYNITCDDNILELNIISKKSPKFKSVPSTYFAQVFKNYFSIELNDNDMLFTVDGMLAQFKEGIYGELPLS